MPSLAIWALLVGNAAIVLAQAGRDLALLASHLWLPLIYTGCHVALTLFLALRRRSGVVDPVLVAGMIALSGIGLAALARLDPSLALRQSRWLLLGAAVFAAIAHAPVWPIIRRYTYVWWAIGLALLLGTALFGTEIRGARSWIVVGGLGFQPVEVVKLLFVFSSAAYLAEAGPFLRYHGSGAKGYLVAYAGPLGAAVLLFGLVLALQRDLGAALLLFCVLFGMLTAATAEWRLAAVGAGIAILSAGAAALMFDHVGTRFAIWINPWAQAEGRGYQIVESLFAVAGGGLLGRGLGMGLAGRIPAVETDFIFSLLAEEIGLVGVAGVLFLLAVVSVRIVAAGLHEAHDDALKLAAAGLGLLVAVQSFLIVGGVTRLLPVTGVTLPFVSYGGSSLIVSFIQAALAYNLASAARRHEGAAKRMEVPSWSAG